MKKENIKKQKRRKARRILDLCSKSSAISWTKKAVQLALIAVLVISSFLPNVAHIPPLLTTHEAEASASDGYSYFKEITINSGQVAGSSDHANFPVLISEIDNDLRTTANGGHVESPNGYDLIFTSPDGKTKYDFEIEKYDGATGEIVAWVKVPTLDYDDNTILRVCYGNASVVSSQQNAEAVWNSNFAGVWHLHDDFLDSTSNNNDATNTATNDTGGLIADGQNFNGTSAFITTTSDESKTAENFTWSIWFKSDGHSVRRHLMWQGAEIWDGNGWGEGVDLTPPDTNPEAHITLGHITDANVFDGNSISGVMGQTVSTPGDTLNAIQDPFTDTTSYHYAVGRFTNLSTTPTVELFVDGVLVASDTGLVSEIDRALWDRDLKIGGPAPLQRLFDGIIDEPRVSTSNIHTDDWITTEYNSISSPSTFYSVGPEQSDFNLWPFTTASNYIYDTDKIEIVGGIAQLKGSDTDWWNADYGYRQKVHFDTNHSTLPENYTVTVAMDTQTATTDVELANGDDVRVVWDPVSGADVELDRIGDSWNNANTLIGFRLQSEIEADLDEDADGTYYIYYGHSGAGSAPDDEMGVYYFADFFNRSNSSTVGNGWTEWETGGSTAGIVNNTLQETGSNSGPPDAGVKQNFDLGALTNDFILEFDWDIGSNTEGNWTAYTHIGDSMSNSSRTNGVALGLYQGEGSHFSPNNTENLNSALNNNLENNINGAHSFKLEVDYSAKTFDYYRDDILRTTDVPFVNSGTSLNQIRMANDQFNTGGWEPTWDNVKIRLSVANGPEMTIQPAPAGYPDDEPTVRPITTFGVDYSHLIDFTATEMPDGGSVRYKITNDGTNASPTWYYWNGSSWVVAGAADYNDVTTVDANIDQFPADVGTGNFSFLAYLISDGTEHVRLDNVNLNYLNIPNSAPAASNVTGTQKSVNPERGKVLIGYTAIDQDSNSLNINTSSGQAQYSLDSTDGTDGTWFDATLAGTTSNITSSPGGTAHNESFEPLYWDAQVDLGDVYDADVWFRMRLHDGTEFQASYQPTDSSFPVDAKVPTNVGGLNPPDTASGQLPTVILESQTASDDSLPVEYYFEIAEDAAFSVNLESSGWQSETTWDPILALDKTYYWRVAARDPYLNESAYGSSFTFDTNSSVTVSIVDTTNYGGGSGGGSNSAFGNVDPIGAQYDIDSPYGARVNVTSNTTWNLSVKGAGDFSDGGSNTVDLSQFEWCLSSACFFSSMTTTDALVSTGNANMPGGTDTDVNYRLNVDWDDAPASYSGSMIYTASTP